MDHDAVLDPAESGAWTIEAAHHKYITTVTVRSTGSCGLHNEAESLSQVYLNRRTGLKPFFSTREPLRNLYRDMAGPQGLQAISESMED